MSDRYWQASGRYRRIRHDPRHEALMQPHVTLMPKGGMLVTLERRNE